MSPLSKPIYEMYDVPTSSGWGDVTLTTSGPLPVMFTSHTHRTAEYFPSFFQQLREGEGDYSRAAGARSKVLNDGEARARHRAGVVVNPTLKRTYGQTEIAKLLEERGTAETRIPGTRGDSTESTNVRARVQDSTRRHFPRTNRGTNKKVSQVSSSTTSHASSPTTIATTPHVVSNMHSSNENRWDRPRSRSIAIVKQQQRLMRRDDSDGEGESFSDTSSNEQMYDWATWRMYNRIIDHRRNRPETVTVTQELPQKTQYGVDGDNCKYSRSSHGQKSFVDEDGFPEDNHRLDNCYDGEVFELEI